MRAPTRWITAVNSVLGLWLIATPFVLSAPPIDRWNDVIVGISIVLLTGFNHNRERTGRTASKLAAELTGVLGGWLIVAPFVNGVTDVLLWNDVGIGVLVTSFAGYNVYAVPRQQRTTLYTAREDA